MLLWKHLFVHNNPGAKDALYTRTHEFIPTTSDTSERARRAKQKYIYLKLFENLSVMMETEQVFFYILLNCVETIREILH